MDWLSDIPPFAWGLFLLPIIMALLLIFSRGRVKPDADGMIRLQPSILLHFFGVVFGVMAIGFTATPFFFLFATSEEMGTAMVIILILYPPLALLMWYGVYGVSVVRVRFNETGIFYKGLARTLFVQWIEVRKIVDGPFVGTYVSTDRGWLIISKYLRGFPQLIEEAQRHNVEIDAALHT